MITIPTILELYTTSLANLEAAFDADINPVGKAELRAQAAAQAADLKMQYLAIAATQENIFVDTCDEPTLIRFGVVKIGRQPFSAVAGQYSVNVTGSIGAVIPAQSIWKSDDDALNPGILYILDQQYTMVTTSDNITLRSLTLGIDSQLDINDTLTAVQPIPLVDFAATVVAEVVQPLAAEDIETYRSIVLQSFRLEPQGGASTDYRLWAADVQGVVNVYPYAVSGQPWAVNVFVESDIADSIDGKGTPSQTMMDAVDAVINFDPDTTLPINDRGRKPIGVILNILPTNPHTVSITVTGFQNLDAQTQTDLLAAFGASVNAVRPFVAAADDLSTKNDIIDVNKLNAAVYNTRPGSVYVGVSFTVDGVSTLSYTFSNGDIPFFDTNIIYN